MLNLFRGGRVRGGLHFKALPAATVVAVATPVFRKFTAATYQHIWRSRLFSGRAIARMFAESVMRPWRYWPGYGVRTVSTASADALWSDRTDVLPEQHPHSKVVRVSYEKPYNEQKREAEEQMKVDTVQSANGAPHATASANASTSANASVTATASDPAAMLEDLLVFHDPTLADVIGEKKARAILRIGENSTIYDAIKLMDQNHVGALLVTGADGKDITGIVTERDYLTKVALRGLNSRTTPVRAIMTANPIFGSGDQSASTALKLMTQRRFRHLPVLNEKRELLGLISIGDLVATVLNELTESVQYYRDFVEGKYRYSKTD
jgi:CBS domain-containing protein